MRYCKDIAKLLFWGLWEYSAIPIKILLSTCSKLSCLSACQKINFITQFFKILQRNSKLVILGVWACLATQTLNYNSNLKKSLTVICKQKIKFILHVFPEILQRYCKLIALGTLGMPGYANQSDNINLQKTFAFICRKKINFTAMLFWRYCKDNADFLLWYFEHTWLHTPKMIVSTCRRLRCLSAYQK